MHNPAKGGRKEKLNHRWLTFHLSFPPSSDSFDSLSPLLSVCHWHLSRLDPSRIVSFRFSFLFLFLWVCLVPSTWTEHRVFTKYSRTREKRDGSLDAGFSVETVELIISWRYIFLIIYMGRDSTCKSVSKKQGIKCFY